MQKKAISNALFDVSKKKKTNILIRKKKERKNINEGMKGKVEEATDSRAFNVCSSEMANLVSLESFQLHPLMFRPDDNGH